MADMDVWNVVLLVAAAYLAVTCLARMMIRRRDQLTEQFRREVDKERARRREAERAGRPKPPRGAAA